MKNLLKRHSALCVISVALFFEVGTQVANAAWIGTVVQQKETIYWVVGGKPTDYYAYETLSVPHEFTTTSYTYSSSYGINPAQITNYYYHTY